MVNLLFDNDVPVISGTNQDDIIYAGPGFNRLEGGYGRDHFVIDARDRGTHYIHDMSPFEGDTISIRGVAQWDTEDLEDVAGLLTRYHITLSNHQAIIHLLYAVPMEREGSYTIQIGFIHKK